MGNATRQPCVYCARPVARVTAKACGEPDCQRQHKRDMAKQRYYEQKAAGTWVRRERTTEAECPNCGTTFESKPHRRAKYCTPTCYHAHRVSQYLPCTKPKRTWIAGTCLICDEPFVSKYKDITCSPVMATPHRWLLSSLRGLCRAPTMCCTSS